jgi:PAS domain S-box-containing protein
MHFAEVELRRAFDEDEFFPVFQPIVELRTGQLIGFEALARWKHDRLGLVPPDEFIPIVEKAGFIDRLTQTVLEKAFASTALVESSLTLSVNISPLQLLALPVSTLIAGVAHRGGFALDRLTIEITESALVDDLERAKSVADELKALHCRLALDDFGTGYSSLKHLHALPFDELKVDRGFVSSTTQKRESRKIVAAVVGLGQSLGLVTVAEGVETQEQADMLVRMGCELGQGWLYGKPVPASELARLIAPESWNLQIPSPALVDEGAIMNLEAPPAQRMAQLQAIYDGAPVGLCFLDRNLRYVSLNRRLAQLNGVPIASHVGRTVAEVIPLLFPKVEPFIRRALQGESITGIEMRKPPQDGDHGQTVMLSYQPAFDEAGEVIGVSVAIMDVSGTRRTEEALRESENHYRHLILLNPHVPWVLDADGKVTDGSPRWEDFTGQPIEEALGDGWLKMLHPDDVEPTLEAIRRTLASGDLIDIEYRVCRPGNEWRWMRSRGAPRFSETGEIIGVYGLVEEVHHQKEVSEALDACQAELRGAINACPVGIVLADAHDCTIFMMNPTAMDYLGSSVFVGQKLKEYTRIGITDTEGRVLQPPEYAMYRSLMHGETVEDMQILYRRSDGVELRLSISSRPINADDGNLVGCVLILRDLGTANQGT